MAQAPYGTGNSEHRKLSRLAKAIRKAKAETLAGYLVDHEFPEIGRKRLLLNARTLTHEAASMPLILFTVEDVTDRTGLETTLGERIDELKRADRAKNEFIAMLAHELRNRRADLHCGDIPARRVDEARDDRAPVPSPVHRRRPFAARVAEGKRQEAVPGGQEFSRARRAVEVGPREKDAQQQQLWPPTWTRRSPCQIQAPEQILGIR